MSTRTARIWTAAGAVVLILFATGIGYASGSTSSSPKACTSSSGRLALLNAHGHCPSGYHAVRLQRAAPAVLGAVTVKYRANKPKAQATFGFAGDWRLTASCKHTTGWNVAVWIVGPSGATYRGDFAQSFQTDTQPSTPLSNLYFSGFTGKVLFISTTGSPGHSEYHFSPGDLFLASNGSSLTVNLTLATNSQGSIPAGGFRCEVDGQLTPSS